MNKVEIRPYTPLDSEQAIELEKHFSQGDEIVFRYTRPLFHARSEVFESYKILCAWQGSELIATVSWTPKEVSLHGEKVKAAYLYDFLVHPNYQENGVGSEILKALFENIGDSYDCYYFLAAGQNQAMLMPAAQTFGMNYVIPFSLLAFPIYKIKEAKGIRFSSFKEVHQNYIKLNPGMQLHPDFNPEKLRGYVGSITLPESEKGGCSLWSKENIVNEQVINLPFFMKMKGYATFPMSWLLAAPHYLVPGGLLKSWHIFDLYANSLENLRATILAARNMAQESRRDFIYLLMQENNPFFNEIKKLNLKFYTIPYIFLAKGKALPTAEEHIYIDVRDL